MSPLSSLLDRIESEMLSDTECRLKQSEYLRRAYEGTTDEGRAAIDNFCIALCGWSFATILGQDAGDGSLL